MAKGATKEKRREAEEKIKQQGYFRIYATTRVLKN